MAGTGSKRSAPSPISIGNCVVEFEGDGVVCVSTAKTLRISSPAGPNINISVDDAPRKYITRSSYKSLPSTLKSRDVDPQLSGCFPLEEYEFLLLNPKDVDSCCKSFIQKALEIYTDELPAMNYAANTGKESLFLERCVSGGKYRTLILMSRSIRGPGEVIAAASYQIIPTDTQYAEIPLVAVNSKYQRKGIGCLLYKELRERLWKVGVLTIFCWADKQSAGFWLKQGFISIGEVDNKGKARRLPVKADIRRALCFPGGSTLMVAHIKNDTVSIQISKHVSLCSSTSKAKPPNIVSTGDTLLENRTNDTPQNSYPTEVKSNLGPQTQRIRQNVSSAQGHPNVTGNKSDSDYCSYGQNVKKRILEASSSSFKSKRIRGGHFPYYCQDAKQYFSCDHDALENSSFDDISLGAYESRLPDDIVSDSRALAFHRPISEEKRTYHIKNDMVLKVGSPRILLMNIADDEKKLRLTKIVERLGGVVTCNGSTSTHVITGKARRTLNFCIALCSGAWIVSPNWLKVSFREGKFLDESQFLLEDEEYRSKHKSELRDAVIRAKENPHSLLRGFDVCLSKHIQPSITTLSAIIKYAGGNVIRKLDCIKEPSKLIFVACEEDMEEAMVAAKKRAWTFSSDWLMRCVMKQELDLEAPQFSESL